MRLHGWRIRAVQSCDARREPCGKSIRSIGIHRDLDLRLVDVAGHIQFCLAVVLKPSINRRSRNIVLKKQVSRSQQCPLLRIVRICLAMPKTAMSTLDEDLLSPRTQTERRALERTHRDNPRGIRRGGQVKQPTKSCPGLTNQPRQEVPQSATPPAPEMHPPEKHMI